jgi:endonuclease/exonuclease/phosphatase family metal-dependent hydrolase
VAGAGAARTIVLGDFNAYTPDQAEASGASPTWPPHLPDDHRQAIMGGVLGPLLEDGYHDALREAPGGPVGGGSLRGGSERPRVDHVLLSSDLAGSIESAEIVRTGAPVDEASDHYPVVVRLRLGDA